MGVAIEPPSRLTGLVQFEHHIYRTAEKRAGHDATADQRRRTRSGDLDPGRRQPAQVRQVTLERRLDADGRRPSWQHACRPLAEPGRRMTGTSRLRWSTLRRAP
jgi:hypothetical protein